MDPSNQEVGQAVRSSRNEYAYKVVRPEEKACWRSEGILLRQNKAEVRMTQQTKRRAGVKVRMNQVEVVQQVMAVDLELWVDRNLRILWLLVVGRSTKHRLLHLQVLFEQPEDNCRVLVALFERMRHWLDIQGRL